METRNLIVGIIVILLATAVGLYFINQRNTGNDVVDEITTFEACVDAGNPVMESYPRRCTHEGQTFVEETGEEMSDMIQVDSPTPDSTISSPLTIAGKARGTWFFEASFPVFLYDANENLIATGVVTADGEWMTEEFVPFSIILTYDTPETSTGTLVLEKSNPSGLPENAASVMIPVVFQ